MDWRPRTGTGRGVGRQQCRPAEIRRANSMGPPDTARSGHKPVFTFGEIVPRRPDSHWSGDGRIGPPGYGVALFRTPNRGAGARERTRTPASVHSSRGPAASKATQVPRRPGRQATSHQVLVGSAPHRARRLLLPPAAGALGAVAPLIGLVGGEQRPPALGQLGKFGSRHGQQGRRVRAAGQLGQHVQPFPHRVAQYLPEDLVHRNVTVTFPPLRRLRAGRL